MYQGNQHFACNTHQQSVCLCSKSQIRDVRDVLREVCVFSSIHDYTASPGYLTQAVTLWTCIRVVLGSSIDQTTDYPNIFRGSPQSVAKNALITH
jgi:hypothetical protein